MASRARKEAGGRGARAPPGAQASPAARSATTGRPPARRRPTRARRLPGRAFRRTARSSPERRACQTLLPVLRAILDVLRGGAPNRALLDGHYVRLLEQASAHPLPDEELRAAARATLLEWALS